MSGRCQDEDFNHYRAEAIRKAIAIFEKKTGAYSNGGVGKRDYWRYHGLKGLAYELYKRVLRMVSTTNQELKPDQMADSLEDMAIDFINYGSFLYAESKCLKEDYEASPKRRWSMKEEAARS